MTVKKAKEELLKMIYYYESLDRDEYEERILESMKMAIKSFESWAKIKEEINIECSSKFGGEARGLDLALKIINKHFKEVKK